MEITLWELPSEVPGPDFKIPCPWLWTAQGSRSRLSQCGLATHLSAKALAPWLPVLVANVVFPGEAQDCCYFPPKLASTAFTPDLLSLNSEPWFASVHEPPGNTGDPKWRAFGVCGGARTKSGLSSSLAPNASMEGSREKAPQALPSYSSPGRKSWWQDIHLHQCWLLWTEFIHLGCLISDASREWWCNASCCNKQTSKYIVAQTQQTFMSHACKIPDRCSDRCRVAR